MTTTKQILFGQKADWEPGLRSSTDPAEYSLAMADLRWADLDGYDAIVPLDLPDHNWLETRGKGVAAVTVPRPMRQLCHDKLALNHRLIDLGFGDVIPPLHDSLPADPSAAPVIIKARCNEFGRDTHLLLTNPVPAHLTALLAGGAHFIQDYIPGCREYATHVLMDRGTAQFWLTVEYEMGDAPYIKGVAKRPTQMRWLSETPGKQVLQAMLAAIGFDQGTCCINYRLINGRPRLFEINPRFGGSLAWRVTPYLRAYLACVECDQRQAQVAT